MSLCDIVGKQLEDNPSFSFVINPKRADTTNEFIRNDEYEF